MPTLDFWEERYINKSTPWDLGKVAPPFEIVSKSLQGKKILVPGCGYGHDALHFAESGFDVSAIDFSSTAIENLQKKALQQNVTIDLMCQNFFDFIPTQPFDVILEHTFFCAIAPQERAKYVDICCKILKPSQGHLIGIFYTQPSNSGPPYGISLDDLIILFGEKFSLLSHKNVTDQMGRGELLHEETLIYFKVK